MTKPRVMMSGIPSSIPVCLLIATTGTTRPSSARWRRSRSTSSPISPVRVPSIRMRPTGAFPANPRAAGVDGDDVAVLDQQDFGLWIAAGENRVATPRMVGQLPVLAVDRDEVAGPDEREDQLQLFLAAMAGHVDVFHRLRGSRSCRGAPGDSSRGRSPSRCRESRAPK